MDDCAICEKPMTAAAQIKGLSGLTYEVCEFCEAAIRRMEIDSYRAIFRNGYRDRP